MPKFDIRLDWSGSRDIPTQPANLVVVQAIQSEFVLTFGYAPPPVEAAAGDDAAAAAYFNNNAVKVQQITQLTLPAHAAENLLKGLQNIIRAQKSEAAAGDKGQQGAS